MQPTPGVRASRGDSNPGTEPYTPVTWGSGDPEGLAAQKQLKHSALTQAPVLEAAGWRGVGPQSLEHTMGSRCWGEMSNNRVPKIFGQQLQNTKQRPL